MAYGDFLYKPDNIIGYTGDLNSNPTVYFFRDSRNERGQVKLKSVKVGQKYVSKILFLNGHITQAHSERKNIGRELIYESWSYSLANVHSSTIEGMEGMNQELLQETYHQSEVPVNGTTLFPTPDGFTDFHVSRSTFKKISPRDYSTIMKLANSIARFPRIKSRYGRVADDYIRAL